MIAQLRKYCFLYVVFFLWVGSLSAQEIDTTGCYLQGPVTIEGCEMHVVSVDTMSQQIRLTWHPSPDERVVGYCICSGTPCLGLDTIWGRFDTTYYCVTHSCQEVHTYSVFAIDSCLHGSAMTDPVSNIVMRMEADTCSRRVSLSWNPYDNIPGGLLRYGILIKADGGYLETGCAADETRFDTVLSQDVMNIEVRVAAVSPMVSSWSNIRTFHFYPSDSCQLPPPPPPPPPLDEDTVDMFFPNVFTPSLSTNSLFCPHFQEDVVVNGYELYIFNRMGLKVFHSTNPAECWNGTHQEKKLPQGVYVYFVTYHSRGEVVHARGTVLLLR